jgi:predicted MFS family arabinose efflux permease
LASAEPAARLDHRRIAVLGILTIACYGAWYYAFGVLIDPIVDDTGWSYTEVSASFSAGQVLIGAASIVGGMMLDRYGSRRVFVAAAALAATAFTVTSAAEHPLLFIASAAVGMGALGALAFYHVTMAAAVRVNPAAPGRAIAALTLWGALSSAIYLPATAWLVDELGWRSSIRVLAASAVVTLIVAAFTVSTPAVRRSDEVGSMSATLRTVRGTADGRRFTAVVALTGLSISMLLVYQVPIMRAAGLGTATAASIAGLRGVAQLGGRIPIGALLRRHTTNTLLAWALVALAVGAVLINASQTIVVAVAFALAAGLGIGAFSPLQGIRSEELFDRASLGATMGLLASISMTAGALGPLAAGVITDATGTPRPASWVAAVSALAAAAIAAAPGRQRRRERDAARGPA